MKKLIEENQKLRKLFEIEGITLIALIISFIIMIILAGVVIETLNKAGLLENSKIASEKYKNASNGEEEKINQYVDSIADYNGKVATTRDANQSGNPTGTIISYMGNNAPDGYLKCDGKEYKISDYKNLAEQIKKEFGSYNYFGGDGTTTFAVSNLQGEFLRGTGTNSHENQGSGENVGTHQDATLNPDIWTHKNGNFYFPKPGTEAQNVETLINEYNTEYNTGRFMGSGNQNAGYTQGVYYSSRPTNTSVLYCIKY